MINNKITSQIKTNDDNFGIILNCAVRYALGRQTYIPGVVIEFITPLLPQLSEQTLWRLDKDISDQAEYGYGNETIDKPKWIKFHEQIKAERIKRKSMK